MANVVTYSVVPRKNPSNLLLPTKYYAQAQASGEMGTVEICERLQRECTLTRADIMAVLVGLEDVVADGIRNGEIVRLGDLCSLQLGLSGKGADKEEEYTDSNITKSRILFRSGRTLREALGMLSFKKVPKRPVKEPGTEVPPKEPETQTPDTQESEGGGIVGA